MTPTNNNWYPLAIIKPLQDHSAPGIIAQRNLIVIHCTEGGTMDGAFETFKSSVKPNRVSAHFIIDRDGKVYQLIPISDTAWAASEVNSRSVNIEHVAVTESLMATEAQYAASAQLLQWLCSMLHIPCNRLHIQGHEECSPKDGHTLCPSGALDIDRLVDLANSPISI